MSDQWEAIDRNNRGSLTAVSSLDGVTIVRLVADPVTGRLLTDASDNSSSFTELAATGAVNGVNTVFTFTEAPLYIVSDHAWYKSINSAGTTNWTGTTSITMTIPPTEDIFGVTVSAGGGSSPNPQTPAGTINGVNKVFTVTGSISALYVNGQFMVPGGVDYTLSGTTITLVTAPPTGSTIYAI